MGQGRSNISSSPILRAIVLALFLSFSVTSASAAPPQSPPGEVICSPSDPQDCYPRTFHPTDKFQVVREGQDIPPGLHVRLNITTGLKEAKINVPGESDSSLNGLPIDGSLVVSPQPDDDGQQTPKGAPAYDPVGKIKKPQQESESFTAATKMLREGNLRHNHAVDESLDGLDELSHDMYYGLKIAEDTEVVRALFCLMVSQHVPVSTGSFIPRDLRAASILVGTLSNNPPARNKVADAWPELRDGHCPKSDLTLGQALFDSLVPTGSKDAADVKKSAASIKAIVPVVNDLLKNDKMRAEFLAQGGMERLLQVLVLEGHEWAGAQRKVGQLALDNFLDADMGAKLGQWPTAPSLDDRQCRSAGRSPPDGCWDHHVARIAEANKHQQGHWSTDLHDKLSAARKASGSGQAPGSPYDSGMAHSSDAESSEEAKDQPDGAGETQHKLSGPGPSPYYFFYLLLVVTVGVCVLHTLGFSVLGAFRRLLSRR
ncbi:hypothetical protein CDD83_2685 [Cordyceps sp. RAO-2017]|nr:hypothetical protein CDD83_2685 [Cordyceps sp. RAO-2017]